MATVTGYTAARMLEIEESTIIDGEIVGSDLILNPRVGTPINAGNVRGPQGVPGTAENGGPLNVLDYGADNNDSVNAVSAFQEVADAIDDEETTSRILYAPSGIYKFGRDGLAADVDNPNYVELGSSITIRGDGPGKTIIKLADDPLVSGTFGPFRNKGRPVAGGGTGLRNHHITFENLTIDGNKGAETEFTANRQGILMEGVDDVYLINVEVKNVITDGIVLAGCIRASVTDCVSHDNLKAGFYFPASDHVSVKGCKSYNNGSPVAGIGAGFSLAASWFCSISDCTSQDDILCGIGMDRDTQFCTISNNTVDTIVIAGNPIAVASGPVASHLTRPEAYVADGRYYYAYNNVIKGNTVRATQTYPGIDIGGGDDNLVEGNIIKHCKRDGIRILGGKRNVIKGNIIQDWGLDLSVGQRNAIRVTDSPAIGLALAVEALDNVIQDNICTMVAEVADSCGINVSQAGGPGISGTVVKGNIVSGVDIPQFWLPGFLSYLEWTGEGTPEAALYLYAPVGSLYIRTDGGAGTSRYYKETGNGNTGWVGK